MFKPSVKSFIKSSYINNTLDKFIDSSIPYITINSIKQLQIDSGYNDRVLFGYNGISLGHIDITRNGPYLILTTPNKKCLLKFDDIYTLKYLSDNLNMHIHKSYIQAKISMNKKTFSYNEAPIAQDNYRYSIANTTTILTGGYELIIVDSSSRECIMRISVFEDNDYYIYTEDLANTRFNISNKHIKLTIDNLPTNIRKQLQVYMTLETLRDKK